jgi:hypothetical protein
LRYFDGFIVRSSVGNWLKSKKNPHVQAFCALADRGYGRLAALAGAVAGAFLGHGAVKLAV